MDNDRLPPPELITIRQIELDPPRWVRVLDHELAILAFVAIAIVAVIWAHLP